jgi:hypothetical protein
MDRAITWRSAGTRSNGARCTIVEVTEFVRRGWASAVPRESYILVDHEPADRVAKGRYVIVPSYEVVTCDHPDAP